MTAILELTNEEQQTLLRMATREGLTVDKFIENIAHTTLYESEAQSLERFRAGLDRVRGMWKDREDAPDARTLRADWDRTFDGWEAPNGGSDS